MIKPLIVFFLTCSLGFSTMAEAQTLSSPPKENPLQAHVDLAANYFQAGHWSIAQEEIQRILQTDPKNSDALELQALIYFKTEQFQEADRYFLLAIQANTQNSSALSNYGTFLCQQGRFDAGLDYFGKALRYPNKIKVSQTLVNGGICLIQKKDYPAAEQFLLKALEQEPFMPAALYQLSRVYYETQRFSLAQSRLKTLHQQVEPNASSLYLLYQLAVAEHQDDTALLIQQKLIQRFPASPEAQRFSHAS